MNKPTITISEFQHHEILEFITKYDLYKFLDWISYEIEIIFGVVKQKVELVNYDPLDIHLGLYVYAEIDDMEIITIKEDLLFKRISEEQKNHFLKNVVIGFR